MGRPQDSEYEVVGFDGELARDLIRGRGLTQRQVADDMGCDPTLLSKWITGDRGIPYESLVLLAARLRVPSKRLATLKARGGCVECPHCIARIRGTAA